MGLGFTPPHPPAQLLLPCSHEGHQLGWGGWKGGVTPIGFRPANALLAGRWVRVAEAGSSCPCGADGANVTAATWHHTPPPAPPNQQTTPPWGGGCGRSEPPRGCQEDVTPPPSAGHQGKERGGVGDTTATIYLSVLPGRVSPSAQLSVPPPLLFAPPRDRAPVTGSAYSFCL